MKNKFPLVGLIALSIITTACTPPQRQLQRPHPNYSQPSNQQNSYRQNVSPAIQARQGIVQQAYKVLGTRYKYGGSTPQEGFDCSGLMTYIHKTGAGISLPRTAAQQKNSSRTVRYNDLQPGDMLFFKTGSKTNHVGIYIGRRQFIHAPNRRSKVKITTMDNRYWHSKFVKFGSFLER
jgi:cell wall-associated NlpC family hydrolase